MRKLPLDPETGCSPDQRYQDMSTVGGVADLLESWDERVLPIEVNAYGRYHQSANHHDH